MPTSAPISRKLKPPKPPCCMRRSAASMISVLTSLMESLLDYLWIGSPCFLKIQRLSIYLSIDLLGQSPKPSARSADDETYAIPLSWDELSLVEATAVI